MKRLLLITAVLLMAISTFWAQDRYTADINYYDLSQALYYTQVPRTITAGTYTSVGTRFTPLYPVTQLNGINVRISSMIAGAPSAVKIEILAVNPDTHLPGGFALASVTKNWAELTLGAWNFFDFSATPLSFAEGTEFFASMTLMNGVPGATWFGPYLNLVTAADHSYRYFTTGTVTGWVPVAYEWHMEANVEYDAPFHDVSANSLWFTGDLLLPLDATVEYEADVENTGDQDETNVPVTIEISDITYPNRTVVFTDTQYIPSILAGQELHVDTFGAYQFTVPGEYIVTLRTGLPGDMLPSNDEILLEQQVVVLPTTLTYDDGTAEGAWAPNIAGMYFVNEFECPVGPVLITELHYYIWPNTWPTPGSTTMGISVFDDGGLDAEGNPGAPGAMVYNAQVDCVRGAWNTYDIADQLVIFSSGKFFVGWKALDAYPNCPGLAVDNTAPWSAWKVSWEGAPGEWYNEYPEYDMDWMIRASVTPVEFWPPENLTVGKSGNDILLDWMDVPEASHYHVYHGSTPNEINTQIGGVIGASEYTHVGGALEPMNFYYVKSVLELTRNSNAPLQKTVGRRPSKHTIDSQKIIELAD